MEAEKPGSAWGKKGFFQAGASVRRRLRSRLPSLREPRPRFCFPEAPGRPKTRGGEKKFLKVLLVLHPRGPCWGLGFGCWFGFFFFLGRRECLFQAKERGWEDVSGAAPCKSVINAEQTSPGSSRLPFPAPPAAPSCPRGASTKQNKKNQIWENLECSWLIPTLLFPAGVGVGISDLELGVFLARISTPPPQKWSFFGGKRGSRR